MDKFFCALIFVFILHFSYQGDYYIYSALTREVGIFHGFIIPVIQRCPSCAVVCKNRFHGVRIQVEKECMFCQCEPIKEKSKLVPLLLCPFKICSDNCGFMGYKQDRMGCKSCECQEI